MADNNIEISKLSGVWKKIAQSADNNGNEQLDFSPNSVFGEGEGKNFLQKAFAMGLGEEDVTAFLADFGLEVPKEALESAKVGQVSVDSKKSKKSAKGNQSDVLSDIGKISSKYMASESIQWDKLAADLRKEMLNSNVSDTVYYIKLLDAVKDVADVMQGIVYDSKADVDKIQSKVKNKLNKKDEFSGFRKDVLNQFVKVAEAHQKTKENVKLKNKYEELRKTKTREEAVKEIKKDKEFKGSYFEDRKENNAYIPGLITQMEDGIVMKEARAEVRDAIYDQRGKGGEKHSEIKKAAKKEITNDKYTAKVLRGERSFTEKIEGQRSVIKDYQRTIASDNRMAARRDLFYNEKELREVFGDNFDKLAKATYVEYEENEKSEKPVMVQNGDGENATYNIAYLSDLVGKTVSKYQLRADYQKKSLNQEDEITNVMRNIADETGVSITRSQAKKLIDFVGADRTKRTLGFYARQFFRGAVKGITGVAGPVVTALATSASTTPATATVNNNFADITEALKNKEFPIEFVVNNDFHMEFELELNPIVNGQIVDGTFSFDDWELTKQLAQAGFSQNDITLDSSGNTLKLIIDKKNSLTSTQMHKLSEILGQNFDLENDLGLKAEAEVHDGKTTTNKTQAMLYGMLTNMALGGIIECLQELPGEDDFLQTDVTAKTVEGYARELEYNKNLKNAPGARDAILGLAKMYVKKDENGEPILNAKGEHVIDNEAYSKLLKELAGPKSFLCKSELINGLHMYQKEHAMKLKQDETVSEVTAEATSTASAITQNTESTQSTEVNTYSTNDKPIVTTTTKEKPIRSLSNEKAKNTSWAKIAQETYPDLITSYKDFDKKHSGLNNAIRIIKLAQAIKDPKLYSKENMDKLLRMSYDNPQALKDVPGFDYEVFKSKRDTGALVEAGNADDVLYTPDELAGAKWVKEAGATVVTDDNKASKNEAPKKSVAGKEVEESRVETVDYQIRRGNGEWESFGTDVAKRDSTANELEKKGYKKVEPEK